MTTKFAIRAVDPNDKLYGPCAVTIEHDPDLLAHRRKILADAIKADPTIEGLYFRWSGSVYTPLDKMPNVMAHTVEKQGYTALTDEQYSELLAATYDAEADEAPRIEYCFQYVCRNNVVCWEGHEKYNGHKYPGWLHIGDDCNIETCDN